MVILLSAIVLIVLFGIVAFSVDYGYMAIAKSQLQNAADAAALASATELANGTATVKQTAKQVASANKVGSTNIVLPDSDIEVGFFDLTSGTFTAGGNTLNATRIRTSVKDRPLFFAAALGHTKFDMDASATAMINPRDIVFAVDLSGSMNDDVEPCWATKVIANRFKNSGKNKSIGEDMVSTLYADLNFGSFPGKSEGIGQNAGIKNDKFSYGELTDDNGPLSKSSVPSKFRIKSSDSEWTRKTKAYKWMMEYQVKRLMPEARPVPDPDSAAAVNYWTKYFDYIIDSTNVGSNPPKPKPKPKPGPKPKPSPKPKPKPSPKPKPKPSPPSGNVLPTAQDYAGSLSVGTQDLAASGGSPKGTPRRGSTSRIRLPPSQDWDRIDRFNNPNTSTFPGNSRNLPRSHRNQIGYRTYVQFMLDWGRERSPTFGNHNNSDLSKPDKVQLSVNSPFVRYHNENVNGQTFAFPPRTQPMHACRRSLIRAIQLVKQKNSGVGSAAADRVAIVTYDGQDAFHKPELLVSLTSNYDAAMQACTKMQAAGDIGNTTATENGIIMARNELEPAPTGNGRLYAQKVLVLLTDGIPNVWQTPETEINDYIDAELVAGTGSDFYAKDFPWYNSALVQASQKGKSNGLMFSIGMGLGADYDFLDRMARFAGTDQGGQSPRSSGDPSAYETELTAILEDIIKHAGTRLVQ